MIDAGVTEIRSLFPPDVVPGIVNAYLKGLRAVYIMVIALAGAATLAAMTHRWQKLKLDK